MKLDTALVREYDIMSALRGPDYRRAGNDTHFHVKLITTAVIRHFVTDGHFLWGACESPESAQHEWAGLTPRQRRNARNYIRRELHFRSHFIAALLRLSEKNREAGYYYTWFVNNIKPWDKQR